MSFSELAKRPETTPYNRLEALGIVLPPPPPPVANFVTHVQEGSLLFLSGQGPTEPDGSQHTGMNDETLQLPFAVRQRA